VSGEGRRGKENKRSRGRHGMLLHSTIREGPRGRKGWCATRVGAEKGEIRVALFGSNYSRIKREW